LVSIRRGWVEAARKRARKLHGEDLVVEDFDCWAGEESVPPFE
jgi:hypothetical protein